MGRTSGARRVEGGFREGVMWSKMADSALARMLS